MKKCATDLNHRYLSALDMNGSIEEDHLAKKSTADESGPALLGFGMYPLSYYCAITVETR